MTRTSTIALSAGLLMTVGAALADDTFEGAYLQNQACRGDKSDPEFLRVSISPREISYAGGVCSIDDRKDDGKKIAVRVTCKFKSGSVMSDNLTFTLRDDSTLHMAQKDGYTANLYRCPAAK